MCSILPTYIEIIKPSVATMHVYACFVDYSFIHTYRYQIKLGQLTGCVECQYRIYSFVGWIELQCCFVWFGNFFWSFFLYFLNFFLYIYFYFFIKSVGVLSFFGVCWTSSVCLFVLGPFEILICVGVFVFVFVFVYMVFVFVAVFY